MAYYIAKPGEKKLSKLDIIHVGGTNFTVALSESELPPLAAVREGGAIIKERLNGVFCSLGGVEKSKHLPLRSCDMVRFGQPSWTTLPARKVARHGEASTLHGTGDGLVHLFFVGGRTESNASDVGEVLEVDSTQAEIKVTCGWRKLPTLISGRHSATLRVVGGHLFLIGGRCGPGKAGRVLRDILSIALDSLDSETGTWRLVGQLSEGRFNCNAVNLDGRYLAIIGGFTGVKVLDSVEIFDTQEMKCFTGPSLHCARERACVGVLGSPNPGLMVFGGRNLLTHKSFRGEAEVWYPNSGQTWLPVDDFVLPEDVEVDGNEGGEMLSPGQLFTRDDLESYSLENSRSLTNSSRWRQVEEGMEKKRVLRAAEMSMCSPQRVLSGPTVNLAELPVEVPLAAQVIASPPAPMFSKPAGWRRTDSVRLKPSPEVPQFVTCKLPLITHESPADRSPSPSVEWIVDSPAIPSDLATPRDSIVNPPPTDLSQSENSHLEETLETPEPVRELFDSILASSRQTLLDVQVLRREVDQIRDSYRENRKQHREVYDRLHPVPPRASMIRRTRSKKNLRRPVLTETFRLDRLPKSLYRPRLDVIYDDGEKHQSVSIAGSWDDWSNELRGDTLDGVKWFCPMEVLHEHVSFNFIVDGEVRLNKRIPKCAGGDFHSITLKKSDSSFHLNGVGYLRSRPIAMTLDVQDVLNRGWEITGYTDQRYVDPQDPMHYLNGA
eukprot:GHVH01013944.1.p1 GENE.GHVH01013944.1~~GHVH01013944.1.p1  ORF type:complete len:721 (-),score=95.70 GHVH01013944.1:1294-3456(-)